MGRIMLATSANTDEEYGGTTNNAWKYAGEIDMENLPSGAFTFTATESGIDFVNSKEILFLFTMDIGAVTYPRISAVNPVRSDLGVGIDVVLISNIRCYALGVVSNATTINFAGASNGGVPSTNRFRLKIFCR